MSNVLIDRQKIDILANAISDKSGVPITMTLDEMVEAVDGIETGGGEPNLQAKTYTVDSAGTATITADSGYDGLSSVAVSVPSADPYIGINSWVSTESGVRKYNIQPTVWFEDDGDVVGIAGWMGDNTNGDTFKYNTVLGGSVTPTESSQTIGGADYHMEGAVTVNAIPSDYVGSSITRRSSSDLTASGATVTVPSGYYASSATKQISNGSAEAITKNVSPSISVSNAGLITANVSSSSDEDIVYSAGYFSANRTTSLTITGSATEQLETQGATTITPSTSQQTAVAAGKYTTGAVTVAAIPSGTAGTPTATKGTVSNHSISVTPSVTNTTGYITGSTKTGTAVTVTASELVSGTYTVDSSGTKDVTNYASASVPAGTAGTPSASKGTVSNHSVSVTPSVTNTTGWITGSTKTGTAVTVSASELVSGSETKTANGTYDVTNLASLVVDIDFVTYYTGTSDPASSLGSNGDIYLKVVS